MARSEVLHVLALYDQVVTIGGEIRLKLLLMRSLLRGLYATLFPVEDFVGLDMSKLGEGRGEVRLRLDAAVRKTEPLTQRSLWTSVRATSGRPCASSVSIFFVWHIHACSRFRATATSTRFVGCHEGRLRAADGSVF